VDAADPRRRDADEEGVMRLIVRVIARRARRAEAISAARRRAGDCFASLAMTLFVVLLSALPVRAADGDVDQGRDAYQDLCSTCHGRDMINSGTLSFDLRKFPKDDFARFKNSVLNGKGTAMPAWTGKISDEDIANLWAYVRSGG
jgi:mono/diheme cytochrome c family protein